MDRFFSHNNTTSYIDSGSSWLSGFVDCVRSNPERIAVVYRDKKFSYKSLDGLSNWVARRVLHAGSRSPFVGVCIRRSMMLPAVMIGIQKAGKAYLPIDTMLPAKRAEYMINSSGCSLVITEENGNPLYPEIKRHAECIDIANISEDPDSFSYQHEEKSPAYILYTSGSTGSPKGVVVPHGAFYNFLMSMNDSFRMPKGQGVLALTTVSFDISGLELFLPLMTGGFVYLLDTHSAIDPHKLKAVINSTEITLVQATPVTWKMILSTGAIDGKGKIFLCGGEKMSTELCNSLLDTEAEVWNMYGPTETTVWSSMCKMNRSLSENPPIGTPIADTGLHILDASLSAVEPGEKGELYISGRGLALGYFGNKELTEASFITHHKHGIRLYKTGDLVMENADGTISYLGRMDSQLKVRGYRIESGEVEKALKAVDGIQEAVVLVRQDASGNDCLAAFLKQTGPEIPNVNAIREFLSESLPEYMIPTYFRFLNSFPTTPNNKIDRNAFPQITSDQKNVRYDHKSKTARDVIREIWISVLDKDDFNNDDNFFDVGGYSLLLIDLQQRLSKEFSSDISISDLMQFTSVNAMTDFLDSSASQLTRELEIPSESAELNEDDEYALAVVGLSCAVPGAQNEEEFWKLLVEGRCGISEFSYDELKKSGIDEKDLNNPDYVRRSGYISGADYFDAEFFGVSPQEARFMDPQHRLFLEHSYRALESASLLDGSYTGKIGVFAGCGQNQYLLKNIMYSSERENWSAFQTMIGNDKDFLATRVAYRLNLRGPAVTIQTACSTSLVALNMAYQSLISYQSDAALCGAVSLNLPLKQGYESKSGSIFSPDGVCRAFDAGANGTVFGSGTGVVALKRYSDAVKDGDDILAKIRGISINNDGNRKIGFTAPAVAGQTDVISEAIRAANVRARDISYIEAHGTGTVLGDPIELKALSDSFSVDTAEKQFCGIGSVKPNVGHLDAAAGIIGLIKVVLSLRHRQIPPSIHFRKPNPELDIENSPFRVVTELEEWNPPGKRIAGVSSFGIGGTNAHVILEEYNQKRDPGKRVIPAVIPMTAASFSGLLNTMKEAVSYIETYSDVPIEDIVFTYSKFRSLHAFRGGIITGIGTPTLVAGDEEEASESIQKVFLFSGQGTQYSGMARILYDQFPVFRKSIDECLNILEGLVDWDARTLLLCDTQEITKTEYTQPLLFCVEYSMVKLLKYFGVHPDILIGHSLGEIAAACVAEAFSPEDALWLLVERGRILQKAAPGRMTAVFASRTQLDELLLQDVSIAGENSCEQTVISGSIESIQNAEKTIAKAGIMYVDLKAHTGFHSSLMDPLIDEFRDILKNITFSPITIPVSSNIDGELLTPGHLYTVDYWARHLRHTVLFLQGVKAIPDSAHRVFIEVGPGNVLSNLAAHIMDESAAYSSLPSKHKKYEGIMTLFQCLIQCFSSGVIVDWLNVSGCHNGSKAFLPGQEFSGKRYWIEPDLEFGSRDNATAKNTEKSNDVVSDNLSKEERLIEIWKSVFGYEWFELDTNFFEIGGDSLLAVELVSRINSVFNCHMALRDVFIFPTIQQQLSNIVEHNNAPTEDVFPILFPVQTFGSLRPLFLVAGAHENRYFDEAKIESNYQDDFLRYFASLIQYLGRDIPIYGFRPKGIFYGEKTQVDVKSMAKLYIRELKKIQPEGPYFIGGECVGGIIAYEIAQQLTSAGDSVEHLILMDTPKPSLRKKISEDIFYFKKQIKMFILNSDNLSLKERVQRINYILFPIGRNRHIRQVMHSSLFYQRKLLSYRPIPYRGRTTLIVNENWNKQDPALLWTEAELPEIDVKVVPGNHITRLSEYGVISADIIKDVYSSVESN